MDVRDVVREDKDKANITNNKYFNTVYSVYLPEKADGPRPNPNPADALIALFELYIKNAGKTYLGFIPGANHTHTKEVTACLLLIKNNKTHTGISNVFAELNKIEKINPIGALEQLLGVFFSIFPQYLHMITQKNLHDAILHHQSQAFWDQPVEAAIQHFIKTYRDKPDSIHHEQLTQMSLVIAKDQVDAYADFLLTLINQKRSEARPQLFKGWVASALGALSHKLSHAKKMQVADALQAELDTNKAGLATIGLCEALANLLSDTSQLTCLANHLHRYTLKELPDMLDLFGDHHRDTNTLSFYMPKIFNALDKLNAYLEPRMKSAIIDLLIEPKHIYPLRAGIQLLWSWQTKEQSHTLMTRVINHTQFVALTPICELLTANKNDEQWPAFTACYAEHIKNAITTLGKLTSDTTDSADQMLLLSNSHFNDMEQIHANILGVLAKKLTKCQAGAVADDKQIALHQALVQGMPWCNQQGKTHIATLLFIAANDRKNTSKDVIVSAASHACKFVEFLKPNETYTLRDILLKLLESTTHRHKAAVALRTYALHIQATRLPELMTRLLTYHNPHAELLLANIHDIYQSENNKLKNTPTSVI